MSNQTIFERMLQACDRFDDRQIDATQFADEISSLTTNLEAIPQKEVSVALRKFENELWFGNELGYPGQENGDEAEQIARASAKLREWIATQLARSRVNPPAPKPDATPERG